MPSRSRLLALALVSVTPSVLAQTPATAAQPVSFVGEMVAILVPLALIVLALFVALRIARKRYGLTAHDAPLSVAHVVPLGPRERVVVLKTRTGRVFAVGVTGQSIQLIKDLDPEDLIPVAESPVPAPPRPLTSFFRR